MRVVTLIGNRPQFVKAAAVSRRLRERHEEILVHSGQHYDDELSTIFFEELELPPPEHELGVGSGSDGDQVVRIMHAFEPVLVETEPDLALIYGDTNTTLAGALTAAKLDVPLAHIEAGMRSLDWTMPEERNRVLADHVASLLLCSTETAASNLAREGLNGGVVVVGDVMADVSLMMAPTARERSSALERFGVEPGNYLLVTAHRAGTVDEPALLAMLVDIVATLPLPAIFPLHPRTRKRLVDARLLERLEAVESLRVAAPLGYLDFLRLLLGCAAVLTDSGGVQKEAYLAHAPCLTLRDATEWIETVELGWNRLVGLDRTRIASVLSDLSRPADHPDLYGGGSAGAAVVNALEHGTQTRQID